MTGSVLNTLISVTLKCHVLLQSSALSGLGKQNKIGIKMSPKSLLETNISLARILNMQDYSWRFYLKMQANHQNLQWFRSNTFKTLIMAKRFLMKIQKTAKGFCCDFFVWPFGPLHSM